MTLPQAAYSSWGLPFSKAMDFEEIPFSKRTSATSTFILSWGGGSVRLRCFSQLIHVSLSAVSTLVLRHFSAPRFLRFSRRLISRSVPLLRFTPTSSPRPSA